MLGIKQDALAFDLGEDWNQKKISLLEQKEIIEDPLLKRFPGIKIPVEHFRILTKNRQLILLPIPSEIMVLDIREMIIQFSILLSRF